MSIIPEPNKVYLCEIGEINCFVCIGKENCNHYILDYDNKDKIELEKVKEIKGGD